MAAMEDSGGVGPDGFPTGAEVERSALSRRFEGAGGNASPRPLAGGRPEPRLTTE
jgi:hypothetical protein